MGGDIVSCEHVIMQALAKRPILVFHEHDPAHQSSYAAMDLRTDTVQQAPTLAEAVARVLDAVDAIGVVVDRLGIASISPSGRPSPGEYWKLMWLAPLVGGFRDDVRMLCSGGAGYRSTCTED